ncbi:MAG: hypothetical protein AABX03_00470 [Nanoarchaeota archaeon]
MNLNEILSQEGLVTQTPNVDEVVRRASGVQRPLKVFYGETYDSHGNTIDSMKYYFVVANIGRALKDFGFEVDPVVLVADVAACRNVDRKLERHYLALGEERADFVQKTSDVYGLSLRVLKMSDYLHTDEFQAELKRVSEICMADNQLMKMVERSVPESKIEIERKKKFAYSFDEITTIMDLDIKVGPPREDLYDGIARNIAEREGKNPLMSVFLNPTFPLGKDWAYFFAHEGIEGHGITAYKAGSKGLHKHRILVGRTTCEEARSLINSSFISINPELPNPVLDVAVISEMATKRLNNDDSPSSLYREFYTGKISQAELKERVAEELNKNILSKF